MKYLIIIIKMKKIFRNICNLLLVLIAVSACQSIKDGLTGKKNSNLDEFLLQKKNPLVLPPEFNKLPEPKILDKDQVALEEEIDLKTILTKQSNIKSSSKNSNDTIEKSILEKIKSN